MSGLFGGFGEKNNSSSTTNTTTNTYTDRSANAGGTGSIAAGEGASININNLSESVANTALNDVGAVALGTTANNTDLAKFAIGEQYKAAKDSIAAGLQQTQYVSNTLAGLQETAARENQDTRDAANVALQSNAGLTEKLNSLTSEALNRAQAPEATSVATILKPVLIAAGLIITAIVFFTRRGGHS